MFDDKCRDRFKKPKKDIIKKKKYGWYQLKKKLEVPDSFKNILNDNIDYLEIGRCIGTLMQNKVKISKKNFKSLKELICLQNLKGIS